MTSPATVVRNQQRAWARHSRLGCDSKGYTMNLSDNLFAPLSASTNEEFRSGDGGELGQPGKRGKMQALHSSSALACNVFDYWRGRDARPLATALGVSASIIEIEFEQKFPTGLPGTAPNLDVVLHPSTGPLIAIESKFLEPYGAHGPGFNAKYFPSEPGLWRAKSYPRCQELAQALYSGEQVYKRLYAEQLLKHILGLACSGTPWSLLYLWYEVPGDATARHAEEAEHFANIVSSDGIDFKVLTYQTLLNGLRQHADERDRAYLDYLDQRYLGVPVPGGHQAGRPVVSVCQTI